MRLCALLAAPCLEKVGAAPIIKANEAGISEISKAVLSELSGISVIFHGVNCRTVCGTLKQTWANIASNPGIYLKAPIKARIPAMHIMPSIKRIT